MINFNAENVERDDNENCTSEMTPITPRPTLSSRRPTLSPLSINTLPSQSLSYSPQTHYSPNVPFEKENQPPPFSRKRTSAKIPTTNVKAACVGQYKYTSDSGNIYCWEYFADVKYKNLSIRRY